MQSQRLDFCLMIGRVSLNRASLFILKSKIRTKAVMWFIKTELRPENPGYYWSIVRENCVKTNDKFYGLYFE